VPSTPRISANSVAAITESAYRCRTLSTAFSARTDLVAVIGDDEHEEAGGFRVTLSNRAGAEA